jgi:hypothetical protein
MALNSFMNAKISTYLKSTQENKENFYDPLNGLEVRQSMPLKIPSDRLCQFKPLPLTLMK